MKRTLLMLISILLAASSVFGIIASGSGLDDVSDILRYKRNQKSDLIDFVDVVEDRVEELREAEANRTDEEKEYAETVVTDKVGTQKYDAGKAQYEAGAQKIANGQAQYDAAEKTYNEKKAEYDAAEQRLAEGEAQLNAAKKERDAAQAQLDAATDKYERAKKLFALIDNSTILTKVEVLLERFGFTSLEEARAAMKEYEDAQAQLAEANAQISAAEQQIADGKTQLAAAKQQLDNGKAQLDSAKQQLDNGKAQLAAAKRQLDAGQQQLTQNVEKMNEVKEDLAAQDDAKAAVTAGIEILMDNDEIAKLVTDENDYESVIEAARKYANDDAKKLTDELDLRQSLYNLLRIVSIIGIAAGVIGLLAALSPAKIKVVAALGATAVAAAGSIAMNGYGFANGYRDFVYALADGSGSGSRQLMAMLILMGAAVVAFFVALACFRAYDAGLAGKASVKSAPAGYDDEDDDDDDIAEPVIRPSEPEPKRAKKQPKRHAPVEYETDDAEAELNELNELTRRLNEQADRLEAEARQSELEKARREYEEARKRFEAARRGSNE